MASQIGTDTPDLAIIRLLSAMCFDSEQTLAMQADNALYQRIIIPLCDDFTDSGAKAANLILANLILFVAGNENSSLHQPLNLEGLHTATQLIARLQRITDNKTISQRHQKQLKKICVLSRVTIGADVSITSVIIQRLHHHFPKAHITLIGPTHLPQLLSAPYLHHILFIEEEALGLERLKNSGKLQQLIKKEQANLDACKFLLIDPDTRLSQLGLLPLAPEQSTYILPSRTDQTSNSLSTITNSWLDTLLNTSDYSHPAITTPTNPHQTQSSTFTIVLNFGVGHDQNKRVSLVFEQQLISALLDLGEVNIILDSGAGEDELNQTMTIAEYINQRSASKSSQGTFFRAQQSVAELASQIHQAELFIGYDSCSGHIATACSTPAIICFKGAPNPRFFTRWQPESKNKTTSCLKVSQKRLSENERYLLIKRIFAIASSHYQTYQQAPLL